MAKTNKTRKPTRRPRKGTPAKAKSKAKTGQPAAASAESAEIERTAGIPSEDQIAEAAANLDVKGRAAYRQVRKLLAKHLGSDAAARLWLATPGTGFETTALDAIRKGQAQLVLEGLKAQWGRSPIYA